MNRRILITAISGCLLAGFCAPNAASAATPKISTPVITSSSTSLSLTWKKSNDLRTEAITILGIPEGGGEPKICFTATVSPSTTNYPVSRARLSSCGPQLIFRISGKDSKGEESTSSTKPVSALPPAKVTDVSVVSTGRTSATVTWRPLPGTAPASSYVIRLSSGAEKQVSANSPSATFGGLRPGDKLSATVRANTTGVLSEYVQIAGKARIEVGAKPPTLTVSNMETVTCPAGAVVTRGGCLSKETSKPAQGLYTYSCPSGGTVSGSTCVTGGSTPAVGTPTYSCTTGTLDGTSCVTPATTVPATATTTYACPSGSTLIGMGCSTSATPAIPSYSCDSGMILTGSYCGSTTTTPASGNSFFGYSCSSGGVLSNSLGGWICTSTTYFPATTVYSCPTGGLVSGSACITNPTTPATATTTYSCPNGGSLSGSICYSTTIIGAAVVYTCGPTATLSGSYCGSATTTPASGSSLFGYSCPSGGVLSQSIGGWICTSTTYFPATAGYSCPSGYSLSGTACSITTLASATSTLTYSCPTGSTVNGSTCINNTFLATSTIVYTCPSGTTLSGSSCIVPAITTAAVSATTYTCPSGAVLSGTNCVTPMSSTQATASISYVCTTGVLVGIQCVIAPVAVDPMSITQVTTLTTTNATTVNVNGVGYHAPFDTSVCPTPMAIRVTGVGGQINQLLFCLRVA